MDKNELRIGQLVITRFSPFRAAGEYFATLDVGVGQRTIERVVPGTVGLVVGLIEYEGPELSASRRDRAIVLIGEQRLLFHIYVLGNYEI